MCRNSLIAEIVKYNITKDIFDFGYEFEFTGMTVGDVPPQNILSIEEIKDYIQMQEKYTSVITTEVYAKTNPKIKEE